MTVSERLDLIDSIGEVEDLIEKARYLHEEVEFRFFSKDPTKIEDLREICYDFKRYAAFHDLLGNLLNDIAAHLPATDWIETLKADDEAATDTKQ